MSQLMRNRYSKYLCAALLFVLIVTLTITGLGGCSNGEPEETPATEGTTTSTNGGSPTPGGAATQVPSSYYSLTITVSPTGAGTVTNPGSNLVAGTEAVLSAIPETGYSFDYWSGDASGTSSTTTIVMDTNKSVVAHFTPSSIQSIKVSPASATIAMNRSQQFQAVATYSDGSTADVTNSAVWASFNPSTATVRSGGRATGVFPGTVTITATVGTVKGSATLMVTRY